MTEVEDINRLYAEYGLEGDSLESFLLHRKVNGSRVFHADPIPELLDEPDQYKMREVQEVIGVHCGLATVIIENVILSVEKENLLIER